MITVHALVRDGITGRPKIDDPKTVPSEVKRLLTIGELMEMDRDMVRDLDLEGVLRAIHEVL